MKNLILLFCLVAGLFSFSFGQDRENRSLSSFHSIKLHGSMDLVLAQGNLYGAEVVAKGVDTEKVKTEVKNGVLHISMVKGNYRNIDITVNVVFRDLDAISLQGSGDILCEEGIEGDKFALSISGSGDVDMENMDVGTFELSISGSGDVDISGTAENQMFSISGSGDIDAASLRGKHNKVSISGSGDASVYASETLEASVSGSGDISFRGNPRIKNFKSSGSGDIHGN